MRKCLKCDLVFQAEERTRCLYCGGPLTVVGDDVEEGISNPLEAEGNNLLSQIIRDRRSLTHSSAQYIIGSYFKSQTFGFMYSFSRNEYLMGKKFRRFFVQPLNPSSILTLPWVVISFFDAIFLRLLYTSHCMNCNWKYSPILLGKKCSGDVCDYHREYTTVVEQILSGHITETEDRLQKEALIKEKLGKRSAYKDFCHPQKKWTVILDIFCVWFSCSLICYFVILASYPFLIKFIDVIKYEVNVGNDADLEINTGLTILFKKY